MTTDPTPRDRSGFAADRAKAEIEDALALGVTEADLITFVLLRSRDPDSIVFPVRVAAAARRAALRARAAYESELAADRRVLPILDDDDADERRVGLLAALAICAAFVAILVCVVLAAVLIFGGPA